MNMSEKEYLPSPTTVCLSLYPLCQSWSSVRESLLRISRWKAMANTACHNEASLQMSVAA